MQKIVPFLWYNNQAEEAANFYTSIFNNSKITRVDYYNEAGAKVSGISQGTAMTVDFEIEGQEFIALNGGPIFTFTPAISFFVNCKTQEEITERWENLSAGGKVLMELGQYPFSEKYGWLQDKFGLSWQLSLASGRQKVIPFLMFVGDQHGKAEEAINFYTSLFSNSGIINLERYGKNEQEPAGTVKHAVFTLQGQDFMAMESRLEHSFTFSQATSFFVNCQTQEEVDALWGKLTKGGEPEPCGWLKDKYSVTWQIVPTILGEMLQDKNPTKAERVMEAMLKMSKIEIDVLRRAYEQQT